MIRKRIIGEAMSRFRRYGIKSVSMEQIASALRISKRTIYEHFKSKEAILSAGMSAEIRDLQAALDEAESRCGTPVESLAAFSDRVFLINEDICPAFLKEITHYPVVHEIILDMGKRLSARSRRLLLAGIKEGYFKAGSDYTLLSSLFLEQTAGMKPALRKTVFLTLMRGISTPKGLEELDRITNETKSF